MEAENKKTYRVLLTVIIGIGIIAGLTSTSLAGSSFYVSIGTSSHRTTPTVIYRRHYPKTAYFSPRKAYRRHIYRKYYRHPYHRHHGGYGCYRGYSRYRRYYYNHGHYYRPSFRTRYYGRGYCR